MALGDQTDPILVKQNDTRPKIRYTARQGAAQTPLPVTGAVFNMRRNTAPNTVVITRAAATLIDGPNGVVEYVPTVAWSATNDLYQAEFEFTLSDGGIVTLPPGENYIWIKVGDDIA